MNKEKSLFGCGCRRSSDRRGPAADLDDCEVRSRITSQ